MIIGLIIISILVYSFIGYRVWYLLYFTGLKARIKSSKEISLTVFEGGVWDIEDVDNLFVVFGTLWPLFPIVWIVLMITGIIIQYEDKHGTLKDRIETKIYKELRDKEN